MRALRSSDNLSVRSPLKLCSSSACSAVPTHWAPSAGGRSNRSALRGARSAAGGTLETLHSSSSRRDPTPEPLRQDERKESVASVLAFCHRSLPRRTMGTCSQCQGPEGRRHAQAERWQVGRREGPQGSKRTCHRDLASSSGIRLLSRPGREPNTRADALPVGTQAAREPTRDRRRAREQQRPRASGFRARTHRIAVRAARTASCAAVRSGASPR
jgi:hypothetical protein